MNKNKTYALHELLSDVKICLQKQYSDFVWINAEISEINIHSSGHCFLELIEKEDQQIKARARATIWAFTFRMLQPYFESTTGIPFNSGIKVLLKARVIFNEQYGFSLDIKDIDPAYTLGDWAIERQKTIQQLEADGILEMNRSLDLPLVPQRIAIISSPTAAGYGDFIKQIEQNTFGYQFHYQLFAAQMQGEQTENSIITALNKIYEHIELFDIVIIIRGGGAKIELSSFDSYLLASNIAQFPIPIITGIGHERDQSIADIVAHTSLKTPTAVADFLINHLQNFESSIDEISENIKSFIIEKTQNERHKIALLSKQLSFLAQRNIYSEEKNISKKEQQLYRNTQKYTQINLQYLDSLYQKIKQKAQQNILKEKEIIKKSDKNLKTLSFAILEKQNKQLKQKEHLLELLNPQNILNRGYAIIQSKKKIIHSASQVKKGEDLEVQMRDGKFSVKVKD